MKKSPESAVVSKKIKLEVITLKLIFFLLNDGFSEYCIIIVNMI